MAKKKGFNKYKIDGETTYIFMYNRKGEEFITTIDTDDLQMLIDMNQHWHAAWHESPKCFYAQASEYIGDGRSNITYMMHRIIMEVENPLISVDHRDYEGLNNKRYNLRISSIPENVRHRETKNSNNTSGYRNVTWDKRREQWIVQLQVDGTNKVLGFFDKDQLEQAGRFAELMREKYYGEFAGSN